MFEHGALRVPHERSRRSVLLKTAAAATAAGDPADGNDHMARLAAGAVETFKDLPADDDAAAHTRPERDEDTVLVAFAGTKFRFAERGRVRIVGDIHGYAQLDGKIRPSGISRQS